MGKFPVIHLSDLRQIPGALLMYGRSKPSLRRVSTDSRRCGPGDLFVALKGDRFDGHDFLKEVAARGVEGVVVSTTGFERHRSALRDSFAVIVPDTLTALGELARLHRRRFSIPIVAIAGSNGKTGTKDLLAHLLAASMRVLKTEGNLNNHIGVPLTLLRLTPRHEAAVIEVGTNHFGEVEALCRIVEPTHGLVTSIGREHLEFFGDLDGVARAEFELYDYLSTTGASAFAWWDDPYIRRYFTKNRASFPGPKLKPYRLEGWQASAPSSRQKQGAPRPMVAARRIGFGSGLRSILEIKRPGRSNLKTTLGSPGRAGELASVAAVAVADELGVPSRLLPKRLADFKPASSKRMEIRTRRGITFINDAYNSNPDSLLLGLRTVSEYPCRGTKHLVLADMLELGAAGASEHEQAGRWVRKLGFTNLWTFGPLCQHLYRGAGRLTFSRHFAEKKELAQTLGRALRKGDLVYLKGSRSMALETVLDDLATRPEKRRS